ncbi:hypothetical protein GGR52DRAFT_588322 [Hypoxylon sp. FL1284]|nr:hypothetical protein GGR52DRAFT_588322 [Hypoxylon sp. FL1284]
MGFWHLVVRAATFVCAVSSATHVNVAIGNEDWLSGAPEGWKTFEEYRFPMFLDALNKAYPDIQVTSSESYYDGYDIPEPAADDYHVYTEPDTLVAEFNKFDNMTTPHMIGEMAAIHPNGELLFQATASSTGGGLSAGISQHGGRDGALEPLLISSMLRRGGTVGEAVSLISCERNQYRTTRAAHAPIIRNIDYSAFEISPRYVVPRGASIGNQLVAAHPMTHALHATPQFDPLCYVAGGNDKPGGHMFKMAVYNSTDSADVPVKLNFERVKPGTSGELTIPTRPEDPYGSNDPYTGINVVNTGKATTRSDRNGKFRFSLPDLSVAVLDTNPATLCRWKNAP